MSILLAVLLVVTLVYLLGGHRMAGGRYAATNPWVKVQLWVGVIALVFVLAASVAGD